MSKLFCDCKTDEEKSNFFLSGRGVETGVIAPAISNEVAMAFHRCFEFEKQLAAALSIQPDDAALKDKAMTTYEQPKDWIERHLVEDPGGLLACEPSGLNEELKLARQANEFQHQTIKKQAAQIATMRETALNQQKREVMLRDEVTRCRDWFETQAKVTSKGGPSSWELILLRDERDAADEALAATADLDEFQSDVQAAAGGLSQTTL